MMLVPGGIKPSPQGINLALNNLNLTNKNNVLFIGDDAKDINASYAAGVKPITPAGFKGFYRANACCNDKHQVPQ